MPDKELSILCIDGKKYIPTMLLEQLMSDRDRSIQRIELATNTKQKIFEAKTAEEFKSIQIPDEFKMFGKYALSAMNSYVSGFSMAYEDGSPRCYYGNMGSLASFSRPDLYRGELCDYGITSGFSSLGRKILLSDSEEPITSKYLSFLVEQIKRILFMGFLTYFSQFHNFPFGEPLDGLIAQHYGLSTSFIDLTDDIKIALFFACCKNTGNNQYCPITKEDIKRLGEYGVIYHGTSDIARIIGYQPFCRCHRQRGYYIDMASVLPCWEYSLNLNTGFEKYYFERTVSLSERIYNEFDGGKKLFPENRLNLFDNVIQQINRTTSIPSECFDIAYIVFEEYITMHHDNKAISNDVFDSMANKEYWKIKLKEKGFEICNQLKLNIDKSTIDEINRNWDPQEFAKREGIVYSPFIVYR